MKKILVGVVPAADFERARRRIPELSTYDGYDDWLDSRHGRFMGLSLGGADASLETVALDDVLAWCRASGLSPSEAALDAYAEFSRLRSRREPRSAA